MPRTQVSTVCPGGPKVTAPQAYWQPFVRRLIGRALTYGSDEEFLDGGPVGPFPPIYIRSIQLDQEIIPMGGQDAVEGTPTAPSLRLDALGVWKFRWTVPIGTRTISISVKQAVNASPRPTLIVKANASIGVNADVTGTAPSGTSWVTIGPVTITPSSAGAVWVELWNNLDRQIGTAPCYFDTETLAAT